MRSCGKTPISKNPAGGPLPESVRTFPGRTGLNASVQLVLAGLGSALLYVLLHVSERGILSEGMRRSRALAEGLGDPVGRLPLFSHVLGYYGAVLGLFVLFALVLSLARSGELEDRRTRALAFLFPVIFIAAFLWTRPYLSIDLLSYVAQGHLGGAAGMNPFSHGAKVVAGTPLGNELAELGYTFVVHDKDQLKEAVEKIGELKTGFPFDNSRAIAALKSLVEGAEK